MAMEPGEFEVAKMGVTASAQGGGIGGKLLQHTVDAGRAMGATRLYLETNRILTPAIALYERVRFKHLPPKATPYARANAFMEMVL